jgi:hypothetical protein
MSQGISGAEASKKAILFAKKHYKPEGDLKPKTEKRGNTWVVRIKDGTLRGREFKIHIDAVTGKIGSHREL